MQTANANAAHSCGFVGSDHRSRDQHTKGLVTSAALRAACEFAEANSRNSHRSSVKRGQDCYPTLTLRPRGLEPLTFAAAVRRSNPLSYGRELKASQQSFQFVGVCIANSMSCDVYYLESRQLILHGVFARIKLPRTHRLRLLITRTHCKP